MTEKNNNNDRCLPCEISVSAGFILKEYCKNSDCGKVTQEFMKGNMSLRDLVKKIGADENVLEPFKNEGVNLDMTLGRAVELDNKKNKRT